MLGPYGDADAAAGLETSLNLTPTGSEGGDEVVQQDVGEMLVKDALVPKRPEVELERLGLDDAFGGQITDADLGEVGLTRGRTKAGKLVGLNLDHVVPIRIAVRKGLQFADGAGGARAELGETCVFWIVAHDGGALFTMTGKRQR